MDTNQINMQLQHLKCFKGTFPIDMIPETITERPAAVVVNTDPANLPGQHWVAIVLLSGGKAEYFDSFGFPPLERKMHNFLQRHAPNGIAYNSRTLQSANTDTCGRYCVLFIKMRCNRISFCEFIAQFTRYTKKNDMIIQQLT